MFLSRPSFSELQFSHFQNEFHEVNVKMSLTARYYFTLSTGF